MEEFSEEYLNLQKQIDVLNENPTPENQLFKDLILQILLHEKRIRALEKKVGIR